jgi:hypothetical protein
VRGFVARRKESASCGAAHSEALRARRAGAPRTVVFRAVLSVVKKSPKKEEGRRLTGALGVGVTA